MPKWISRSNRIYYDELGEDASTTILYQNSERNLHQLLKQRFNTNDYLPLSAVSQAKGCLRT